LLPDLAGKLRGAQKILKIAENITKMVSKAKSIGDAKSGIPSTDSLKAGAMDKLNEAKENAAGKLSEATSAISNATNPANVSAATSAISGGISNMQQTVNGISAGKLNTDIGSSPIIGKVSGKSYAIGGGLGGPTNF
jgi:hypothetical protein